MTTAAEAILDERQKTHGDFARNAKISQNIKAVLELYGTGELTDVQQEALDMIALKMSRICSGQAKVNDHWRDIAGYAMLAVREIEEEENMKAQAEAGPGEID